MLAHLNIQGLAIISELSIDFTSGYNVITGETGAGKSILIKALQLILGSKATSEVVRKGSSKATVTGQFYVEKHHNACTLLDGMGVPYETHNGQIAILIRRSISAKGRSQAWVNDIPITLSSLKSLRGSLIDIFGQHESSLLLDPNKHVIYLDQFVRDKHLPKKVSETYRSAMQKIKTLKEIISNFADKQRSMDYLEFRYNELKDFEASPEDFKTIQEQCKQFESSAELKSGLLKAQATIDQGASGQSISFPLWEIAHTLESLSSFSEMAEEAKNLAAKVDDLSFDLDRSLSKLDFNESDLEDSQNRLATYQELFRKLAVHTPEELCCEKERLEEELSFISSASQKALDMLKEINLELSEVKKLSEKLSIARKKAAKSIKVRVEKEFKDLAMPGARFEVEFSPVSYAVPDIDLSSFGDTLTEDWVETCDLLTGLGEYGQEKTQFLLASNPGESLMPIQKIASGGEISRIMLALKKALAAGASTSILVFDEIDAGISGRVASMVGNKMKELSNNFQIICISHLAQVAAYANNHFKVHKFEKEGRTESTITKLNDAESINELASLLSGDSISKSSIANAKSLREKALN